MKPTEKLKKRVNELTQILWDLIACIEEDQGEVDYEENLQEVISVAKSLLEQD